MYTWKLAISVAALALTVGCSSKPDIRCGAGTVLEKRTCIAQVKCGEGTVAQDGVCVSTAAIEKNKAQDKISQAVADMAAYAELTCGCKDMACLESADKKMVDLGEKYSDINPEHIDEETMGKITEQALRAAQCRSALEDDGSGAAGGVVGGVEGGVVGGVEGGLPLIGIAECDELITSYLSCDALPEQAKDAFRQGAEAWRSSLDSGGAAARTALTKACVQARKGVVPALEAAGCL